MKKQKIFIYVCVMLLGSFFAACTPPNPPRPDVGIDSVLVSADVRFYGAHYDNIPQNVLSVTLLSKGLQCDSFSQIAGYGTFLHLSDIFIPLADSALQSGIYTIDTTAQSNTILPGMRFERALTGAYLLRLGTVSRDTLLFTSGEMTVSLWNDSIMLDLLLQSEKVRYHGMYQGAAGSCVAEDR